MKIRIHRRLGIVLGVVAFLIATGVFGYRHFVLEIAEARRALRLRLAGVTPGTTDSWGERVRFWSRDFCDASAQACRCVVLLHGLGDRGTTWSKLLTKDRSEWRKPLRLIAIDLPGHGASPPPRQNEGYRLTALARAVREVVEAQAPRCEPLWVVGNSFGGALALHLALSDGVRVSRLVLLSPGGLHSFGRPGRSPPPVFSSAPVSKEELQSLSALDLLALGSVDALRIFQARAYARPRELPEFVWRATARRAQSSPVGEILAAQRSDDDVSARLGEVRTPVLALWGLSDGVTPLNEARDALGRLRYLTLREIPNCGHLPQKECPEEVVEALNELLGAGAG